MSIPMGTRGNREIEYIKWYSRFWIDAQTENVRDRQIDTIFPTHYLHVSNIPESLLLFFLLFYIIIQCYSVLYIEIIPINIATVHFK